MADNVTTQTATLASVPGSTVIETQDTGTAHRQVVAIGGSGDKTSSTAAPTSTTGSILAANATRKSATIRNAGAVTVYLGASGVSTTTGIPLEPGETLTDTSSVDAWHGVTASGTGDLRIIEVA